VRRKEDSNRHIDDNFSQLDIVPIKNGSPAPFFAQEDFNAQAYETVLGHYATNTTEIAEPGSTADFNGAHPFLMGKFANAAIKYSNGLYLLDKQTSVRFYTPSLCPPGYSTVGDSQACYSKTNALELNAYGKLALVELDKFIPQQNGQTCPLGLAMASGLGSKRGICTSVRALREGINHFGISTPPQAAPCPGGEYAAEGGVCLPQLTAVYCDIDRAALSRFRKYPYKTGRHVFYWPTKLVNKANAALEFSKHYEEITIGNLAIKDLKKSYGLFKNDDQFVMFADEESSALPIFQLYSRLSCDKLYDRSGYSLEPFPPYW
jgi:hypothetical protein